MVLLSSWPIHPTKHAPSFLCEPRCLPKRLHLAAWMLVIYFAWRHECNCKHAAIVDALPEAQLFLPSFRGFMLELFMPLLPPVIGFSPHLSPRRADWPQELGSVLMGFWVVEEKRQLALGAGGSGSFSASNEEQIALQKFVDAGPAPVYLGWGSMVAGAPESMTCLAVRALMAAGTRGVIVGGFARLRRELLQGQPDAAAMEAYVEGGNVLFVQAAPHEWLFPRCSVTVHHGGVGTMAAALRSGKPTIITPVGLDQYHNASVVADRGVGLALPHLSKVTPLALGSAVRACLADATMTSRSAELGTLLRNEDGVGRAVSQIQEVFHEEVDSGKWKLRHEVRKRQLQALSRRQRRWCGWLPWVFRVLFSKNPNDYSVAL
eukprot:TRINITY_DN20362_c0_g1_i1.p1 TRINITY_DN20362_c0_g1~~TRINITY_DN20362_c0_g1_i1.p1  ORF type:complete len:414 (-),score=48.19 TRINITY_DN20362_c0_g1_i1:277-1407(-)